MRQSLNHSKPMSGHMNRRRLVLVSMGSLGFLLGVVMLAILARDSRGNKVTVSFVNAESSNGEFPSYVKSERLAFAVRNAGSKPAFFDVSEIKDQDGNWVSRRDILGDVKTGQSRQFYLYLPLGSHPQSLRMRMHEKASAFQKTKFALRMLVEKAAGRYAGKQVWFDGLQVPAGEFTVKVDQEAEADGAADGSQPIRSEKNPTSGAAGSRR